MTTSSDQQSRTKEGVLAGFACAFILVSLVAIRVVFPVQEGGDDLLATQYPTIIGPIIALLTMMVLQNVMNILVRTPWIVAIEAVVVSIGMIVIVGPSVLTVLASLLFIGLAMWAWKSTQLRMSKQKRIGIRWAVKSATSILVWSVLLLATAAYYANYARAKGAGDVLIPKSAILLTERYATDLLDNLSPGVSLSTPVGQLTQDFESSIPDGLPPEIDDILREEYRVPTATELDTILDNNPELKNDANIQKLIEEQRKSEEAGSQATDLYLFLLKLGSEKPNLTVLDGIVQFANTQLQGVLEPYSFYIPLFITLLYLVALRFFASIARWFAVPLISSLLWMLRKAGFYTVTQQQEEVDVLTLS